MDKAFLGRDDGKMRAEIDASQARLKGAWTAPEDLDRLAKPSEKKKLDELRHAWDEWQKLAHSRKPEELAEKQALQKQAAKLGKELEGLADRMLKELGYHLQSAKLSGVRDKARRRVLLGDMEGLINDVDINVYKEDRRKLGEVLDYPELFDAYPELAEMEAEDLYLGKGNYGSYDPQTRIITINEALTPEERRSTLLHEIQHAIQDIEGFAEGSSPISAADKRARVIDAQTRLDEARKSKEALGLLPEDVKGLRFETKAGREEIEKRHNEVIRAMNDLRSKVHEKARAEGRVPTEKEYAPLDKAIDEMLAYEELMEYFPGADKSGFGNSAREVEAALTRVMERNEKQLSQTRGVRKDLSGFELYQRTAGEIESRNVQERRDWTAEQRQATPFNDTLEYPGEAVNFGSFSVTEAKEKKLFDEHGIMHAANGILIDGASFSETMMHASPHWIQGKFRMDKIGSGEGHQAFGSGMYFSENEGVNDKYLRQFEEEMYDFWTVNGQNVRRKDLGKVIPGFDRAYYASTTFQEKSFLEAAREIEAHDKEALEYRRQLYIDYEKRERSAEEQERFEAKIAKYTERTKKKKRKEREESIKQFLAHGEREVAEWEELVKAAKEMREWAEAGNTVTRDAAEVYNYRVEIDAKEGELFYWDDLLSDESNAGALERIRNSPVVEVRELAEAIGANTGEKFYWQLADKMREKHGLGDSRSDDALAARYASEALLASGIKGHKYANGFTRRKPRSERLYNAVVYDMDSIRITHVARGNRDWKPYVPREEEPGGASMSVCGQRAKGWGAAENRGDVYLDRADGKRKFVISTRDVNFREPLTRGMLNVPEGGHKDVTLGNLLQYDELFENYPELKNIRVRIYKSNSDNYRGFYMEPIGDKDTARKLSVRYRHLGDAHIALNLGHNGTEKDWLATLLHEAQHAIQGIEGFAEGGRFANEAEALKYVQKAIALRRKDSTNDSFKKDNLDYLLMLEAVLKNGSQSDKEAAMRQAYYHSHGEQEAFYAGKAPNRAGDHPNVAAPGKESETISVPAKVTDLGGLTFGWMGTFGSVLDRYMPASENFDISRRIFQMKESIVRRMRELALTGTGAGREEAGLRLAAEGMAVIDSLEQLLPNTYRFALEPYKVYFSFYASLHGSGDAGKATRVIPMRNWDDRMKTAMETIAKNLLIGRIKQRDSEFFDLLSQQDRDVVNKMVGTVKPFFDSLMKQSSSAKEPKAKREKDALDHIWANVLSDNVRETLLSMVGEMRAQSIMAKFLQRVNMQLDNYRKDIALGKIRRVVGNLTPAAGKDGRPVKGRISAENYNKVQELMALLELTPGEKARMDEKFEPEEGKTADPGDVLEVEYYTQDGEPKTIRCTRQEWETYACFDSMSAGQAEAMSHALGELITTGRQAWENAEEAEKAAVAAKCAPAMEMYGESPEQRGIRRNREATSLMGHGPKMLRLGGYIMNDAQFFYALTGVDAIAGWAEDARHRIANAHLYMEQQEKRRVQFLADALRRASGAKDEKGVASWADEVNRMQDTGVTLNPQKPDFLARERETLRRQFLGTLWRKTHQKNFRADTFAEALRTLLGQKNMPKELLKEAMDKYAAVGDAGRSRLKGNKAVDSVFTETELRHFADLDAQARERARKAEEKWDNENKLGEPGRRTMSRAQAAYHVLLAEQADYREMMRRQGYTDEALRQLREFAGEDVMNLAYEMREMMGERTAEMKDLYEKIYGMPFPEVDNYFRAYFDAGTEMHNQTVLDNAGYGAAAGGGAQKVFYTRKQHNRPIDPTMSLFNAFNAGMKEQDILLGYGTLPTELTRILNYKDGDRTMADALDNAIGRDAVSDLRAHVRNMTQLAPAAEETARMMSRLFNALSSSQARSILNFRMGTLMKQKTAIFNTLAGSDLVSTGDWFRSMARVQAGLGKITPAEMAKRPELATRFKGWNTTAVMDAARGHADLKVSGGASGSKVNAGMSAIEYIDMRANVKSACILYDAVWRNLKRDNPEWSDAELDAAAMGEVRDALARKSQPLDWRQRSLLSTKRSVMKVGSLFLGGESINTIGHIASLVARGKKGDYRRAASVWLAHGAALQAITFIYNWLTDDEETWERRRWQGYATGVLLGPLMGIPILSQAISLGAGAANQVLPKEWRVWMPTGSVLPMGDIERDIRTFKNADDWLDYTIAANTLVKDAAAIGAIAATNSTTLGQAKAEAVLYTTTAVSNIIDFLLRAARAIPDRLD
ncbi:MAG: ImmA/IrrE family metallo-endopeptidase [Akkermansiaceae bacterium]|nr:ImmA/IrrE family metallo-endopeptidase [Akkermansiaceae bacterium]